MHIHTRRHALALTYTHILSHTHPHQAYHSKLWQRNQVFQFKTTQKSVLCHKKLILFFQIKKIQWQNLKMYIKFTSSYIFTVVPINDCRRQNESVLETTRFHVWTPFLKNVPLDLFWSRMSFKVWEIWTSCSQCFAL